MGHKAIMKFQHYKGGVYEMICEATLESDLTPMMIYRAADGSIWVRPRSVFFEEVNVDGTLRPRFQQIED